MDLPHRIQRTAVWPIGILLRLQIGLENRFEYQHRRRLCHAILDRGAPLTVSVSRLAWVYTLAVPAAVDTFYFSALASVRPTTSSLHTLRCPRRSDHLLLLLRGSLCSIRRRIPAHLLGTPCHTGHRSETWAIPSLCRATPSATSEH